MTVAVVVARGGSVRLPGKALLPFAGTTLVAHKVRTLLKCRHVGQVVVNSDSPEIVRAATEAGAAELPGGGADYHDDTRRMLHDTAQRIDGDVDILWAHPTNPLVRAETYDRAVEMYRDGHGHGYDSLMSVTEVRRHAWSATESPLNFCPWEGRHLLAAELPPIYFQDGAIFIQPRLRMLGNSYFYGRKPLLFPVCQWEGVDIDNREDYDAACALW